ncbi:MAG: molybdopterin-dependent oxidoreductase [Pseudomonadales bacterium]|nr:molybdopterin-dependent oxidoreductase [Pseudomonadales bacterium]
MKASEPKITDLNRRDFLKIGGGGLALSMTSLGGALSPAFVSDVMAGTKKISYSSWDEVYRKLWAWDKITWGTHTNMCVPASCSFRVYSKNGVVWRQEQETNSPATNDGYPDFNPMGCQKGCGFHQLLTSPERLRFPLKRTGERGEGKWKRISWDDALTEIADAILDSHQENGPESFIIDAPHLHAGSVAGAGTHRFGNYIGATQLETGTTLSDDNKGMTHTFGKMKLGNTTDNFFDAELLIMTHCNWSYTMPTLYHFITESRYNGTETVVISPDYNPTNLAADIHLPINTGADAAFWNAVSQVIIEEKLYDEEFVKEQTDMPLLVRKDNKKFLTAEDIGEDPDLGESADKQHYFYDPENKKLARAPRRTLAYEGARELDGEWDIQLANGKVVTVETVFRRMKLMLNGSYKPEDAHKASGIGPKVVRAMARKVATKRTCVNIGWDSAKHYHGDLHDRSLLVAMALTGNWGKPGTGSNSYIFIEDHIDYMLFMEKPVKEGGLDLIHWFEEKQREALKSSDPYITEEELQIAARVTLTKFVGQVPTSIFMYNHAGFDKLWDKKEWNDPALKGKTFGDFLNEALEKKHLDEAHLTPAKDKNPDVMMYINHNPLRRVRSGRTQYVDVLWPKVKMLFGMETRMSSSAAFFDIVLPCAWYYEKEDISYGFMDHPYHPLNQKAVEPPDEAREEWQIFADLISKIGERAKQRGMTTFFDSMAVPRAYADIYNRFTMNGALTKNEDVVDQFVQISEAIGTFPKGYTYEQYKKEGTVRIQGLGGFQGQSVSSEFHVDQPFYSLGNNVDKKHIFPTHTRRAQFYIDQEWFIESGEALPVHKEVPPVGGMHPFRMVSGHPRNSVHTLHAANPHFMKLHRAQPVAFINDKVAAEKGIKDGDEIKVYNDFNSSILMASPSAAIKPDVVTIYMWEPFQFKDWKSQDSMLIGLPKPTLLALNYEQLRFYIISNSPSPTDRGLRVNIEKA